MKGASAVWSRSRKARTAAAEEASEQASARTGEHATMDTRVASGAMPLSDPAPAPANGQHGAPASINGQHGDGPAYPVPGKSSPRALKNWSVRSRLLLLVIIPVLAAVVLGGIRITSSVQSAFAYQRVVQLASLNGKITSLVQALQSERQDTVTFITLGLNGGRNALQHPKARNAVPGASRQLTVLTHGDYAVSSRIAAQAKSLLGKIGNGYPALAQQDAHAAIAAIDGLGPLRAAAIHQRLPALVLIQEYANKINTLLAMDAQVAAGSSDSTLADGVRVAGLVSAMKEEATEEQALITAAQASSLIGLNPIGFSGGIQTAIQNAAAQQQANETAFNSSATASQRQIFDSTLSSPTVAGAQAQVQQAASLPSNATPGAQDPVIANAESSLQDVTSGMHSVETQLVNSVIARSTTLRNNAIRDVIIWGAVVLLVLAIAFIATVAVGRSMIRPLRRLRSGALEVAGTRLPEAVRRINESEGEEIPQDIVPIDVDSTDEIGEVARAFDQVHKEAIGLAGNEAALRGNVNAMFVNLSRRTQSLVQRQIHLIDDLEQGEQDSDRLGSLFRLDHLATRMRRNSENLLVLAGHEATQRWSQPVALVDVLRAAVSEIEQYERVSLNVQPGISVRGQVVNDVVHLLAELLENATSFSSAESQVNVSGHLLNSGGVLLDITDQGVGMPADEMKDANWRLDNPPVVDVAVSRRMGLFVVARLASRHGIRVRLRPGPTGGLTALMWLPDETVTYEASGSPSGLRRFDADIAASEFSGYPPLDAAAADGGSSREAAVAAARVPRFTSDGPDAGEGRPEIGGERADDPGPVPSVDAQAVSGANGLGGAQSASSRTDQADQADRGHWDDVGARNDSEEARFGLTPRISPWSQDSQAGDVVVPPAVNAGDNRLPIFESVESDWFRRGRHEAISHMSDQAEPAYRPAETANGWSSPADDGWRAAEALESPSAAGLTPAGLPRRVPQANLVPGGVTEPRAAAYQAAPTRSASTTRQRMASFQRGAQEGRAALHGDESSGTESEGDA
jgi:signal transduction histidine kinase